MPQCKSPWNDLTQTITRYNDYTGYGRLNAGAALQLIEKPSNSVRHFGTTDGVSSVSWTVSNVYTNLEMQLLENYTPDNQPNTIFVGSNFYKVNVYKYDAVLTNSLSSGERIVDKWARSSSSTGLEGLKDFNNPNYPPTLIPHERVILNSLNHNTTTNNITCNMTSYVYQVFDNVTNAFLGYWPFDPSDDHPQFEFTVLTTKSPTSVIQESTEVNYPILVFPNPTNTNNTISFSSNKIQEIDVTLFDIQGKLIRQVYSGNTSVGLNTIDSNFKYLSNGVYFYRVKIGTNNQYVKFVKQ
jgi:Secretion system C-terminal sorting domain